MQHQEHGRRVLGRLEQSVPLRCPAKSEDIVPMVVCLASDGAGFITGQVISVRGGLTMVGS